MRFAKHYISPGDHYSTGSRGLMIQQLTDEGLQYQVQPTEYGVFGVSIGYGRSAGYGVSSTATDAENANANSSVMTNLSGEYQPVANSYTVVSIFYHANANVNTGRQY